MLAVVGYTVAAALRRDHRPVAIDSSQAEAEGGVEELAPTMIDRQSRTMTKACLIMDVSGGRPSTVPNIEIFR